MFIGSVVGGEAHAVTCGKLGQLHRTLGLGQQVQTLHDHAIEIQQILLTHVAQRLDKQLAIQNGLIGTHGWRRTRTIGKRPAV